MEQGRLARWLVRGAGVAALLAAGAALAGPEPWQLNLSPGVTETARNAYEAHMLVLWICVAIGVIVFGAMAVAMFRFRKSRGAVAATWSHNTRAEVVWSVVPIVLLVIMAWPATAKLIAQYDTGDSEMTVKVTGYQWMWRYEILNYQGQASGVNFVSRLHPDSDRVRQLRSGLNPAEVSDGERNTYLLDVDRPLVLPTDTRIRFVITAADVVHAWWVPALGWKQDAIPGVINEAWTNIRVAGTYRGQCAELCGKDHAFMPIVVEAVPRAQFEQWLAQQQAAGAERLTRDDTRTAGAAPPDRG
ncbi:MAG TPA: cytochrome c oxidase subunit II [Xanthomonadaceae bacterium]|nr:cytochrome c oxidase subunit II [Xanthomonadaceae bacterium]